MPIIDLHSDLNRFGRQLAVFDVPLPPAAVAALARLNRAVERANGTVDPFADIGADILAGISDPATDDERLDAAADALARVSVWPRIVENLTPYCRRAAMRAIALNGDDIIAALRPHVDTAVEGIRAVDAHFSPGSSADRVLASGPEPAALWTGLHGYRQTLDAISVIRTELTSSWAYGDGRQTPVAAHIDPADGARLNDAIALIGGAEQETGGRWHRWVHAGIGLHLNDVTEVAQVVAASAAAARDAATRGRRPKTPAQAMRDDSVRKTAEAWRASVQT